MANLFYAVIEFIEVLGLKLSSATHEMCGFGQVTLPLKAEV